MDRNWRINYEPTSHTHHTKSILYHRHLSQSIFACNTNRMPLSDTGPCISCRVNLDQMRYFYYWLILMGYFWFLDKFYLRSFGLCFHFVKSLINLISFASFLVFSFFYWIALQLWKCFSWKFLDWDWKSRKFRRWDVMNFSRSLVLWS
jgi:hypothetical protein